MDLEELITVTKQVKEDFCLRERGPADVLSVIRVEIAGDTRALMIPVLGEDDPLENLKSALGVLLEHFRNTKQALQFERIAYVCEGYVQMLSSYPNNYKRGHLEELYKNDPTSDVNQCLMINLFNWDCSSEMAIVKYGYDDFGKPVFEQEEVDKSAAATSVLKVMQSFRAYCKFKQEDV